MRPPREICFGNGHRLPRQSPIAVSGNIEKRVTPCRFGHFQAELRKPQASKSPHEAGLSTREPAPRQRARIID